MVALGQNHCTLRGWQEELLNRNGYSIRDQSVYGVVTGERGTTPTLKDHYRADDFNQIRNAQVYLEEFSLKCRSDAQK